jgi:sigma-B regulation protein RsbU (phosphoserine phosphatase)
MSARALLRMEFPAQADALKAVREALNRALDRVGVAPAERDKLVLAVHEAACNVIRHAYGNCGQGRVRLSVSRVRGQLRFVLRDYAPPVDPGKVKPRDLSVCRPGGLGINFIDDTMDRWALRPIRRRAGNVLIMRKRLGARSR